MAHPELIYPGYLKGGEPVEITNMHPDGPIRFNLPHVHLNTKISVEHQQISPQFNLETLILEPNQFKLSMVWRAAMQCDKKVLKISSIKINLIR